MRWRGVPPLTPPVLGFIGFGEAGSRMALGLRESGIGPVFAYDIAAGTGARGDTIRRRAAEAGVTLTESNAELARHCSILLSVVTAASAVEAARQNLPHLETRHIYIDGNSVSPERKREIASVIQSGVAGFVEAAILAPVPKRQGQSVAILTAGAAAGETALALAPFGFSMEPMDAPIGTASAVKMCRSIVVKGMEALLTECVLAASEFGAEDRVFASLQQSYPGIEWKRLADYMVNRLTVHGERRAREMEQVAEMLLSIGVDPIMAEAAARRQDWSAKLGLAGRFGPDGPANYQEVLDVLRVRN